MLLLHQTGSVKIGEVVRYTVTYTPSRDRILPSPEHLHLRIRNSSAIARRAAFVHGPYNLSVAAYPATFNPNEKFEDARQYGVPEFEPMLKAGGTWSCHLIVPENIRQTAVSGASGQLRQHPEHDRDAVSWIIEVASQVMFSVSASVHYEVLLAHDEKSLSLSSGFPVVRSQAQAPQPGRVSDFQHSKGAKDGRHTAHTKGVLSNALYLKVQDTASLWNTPKLPEIGRTPDPTDTASGMDAGAVPPAQAPKHTGDGDRQPKKHKHVHLVVLTHGLHSNLGADMLYLKESIDAAVRQAKADAKKRREVARRQQTDSGLGIDHFYDNHENSDDEETIVRGFPGNATRTERGIKYLGKRLARYVLSATYPDQPFLPTGKARPGGVLSHVVKGDVAAPKDAHGKSSHKHRTSQRNPPGLEDRGYRFTKISFIGHSLGGLIQTYAVAYIHKHSPRFFDLIKPINFVALASPFLGLNHENPMYVRFALDFGLVGRTGKDLGLTWRALTIARNGWSAIASNLGENAQKKVVGETQPESKPLLRILPTGPAHTALRKFRNRTVYSNVVNDGIVPLRTSCLLFLDWQGLGRVEKARREAGIVGTVFGFGWAELTGANFASPRSSPWTPSRESSSESNSSPASGATTPLGPGDAREVPQPPNDAVLEDDNHSLRTVTNAAYQDETHPQSTAATNNTNPFSGLLALFKHSNASPASSAPPSSKKKKIYERSQTLRSDEDILGSSRSLSRSKVTSGHEVGDDAEMGGVLAPPTTTFFESAGDLLNPKLPSVDYLIDPSKRPRTIFHDRVYHPSDIPPPRPKKRPAGSLALRRKSCDESASASSLRTPGSMPSSPFVAPQDSLSSSKDCDDTAHHHPDEHPNELIDSSNMKVEEQIARAYHRDLSWRKVLVKLEPDAHNNMICRRMFANAFGWPVIKHLVDAHFSDSVAARMGDQDETNTERAKAIDQPPDRDGSETTEKPASESTAEHSMNGKGGIDPGQPLGSIGEKENRAVVVAQDKFLSLPAARPRLSTEGRPSPPRHVWGGLDSEDWSERFWTDSGTESEIEEAHGGEANQARLAGTVTGTQAVAAERTTMPLSGFWTEKIVGKGAANRRSKSHAPGSQAREEGEEEEKEEVQKSGEMDEV